MNSTPRLVYLYVLVVSLEKAHKINFFMGRLLWRELYTPLFLLI
ncbi:hypothetical protein OCC_13950 [Thermococcus litoralis DSM 5473]|uniref:Uncharacterized protein n=1 Tax=Thermococcus litoralis (strain ATCC 51850 / DSM 5473 / JCM 8560 / NS-C) TaxID=523849 RepID=S6A4J7_THELN|nr:hypothetical protein OCC_13950 [Thermococcus litoralis DSM 5473]